METMLKDDAAPEFPPLTPPSKAGRRPHRPLHKKLKKTKAGSQESDLDSDEDTRQECQKKAKKKKMAKTKTTELTQWIYADVLLDDDISSSSKASMASLELKWMFKSLMLNQQQEMTARKWEQKANALVIANLKHQNQVLQSQFKFLAMELEERSRGDSSLSSIVSMVSVACSLSFIRGKTPTHPTTVSIGTHSKMATFTKESPTTTKLNWEVTATKNPKEAQQPQQEEWVSPSCQHMSHGTHLIAVHSPTIKTNNQFASLTLIGHTQPRTLSPPKVSKKHYAAIQERVASKLLEQQAVSNQAQMAVNMDIEQPCNGMTSLKSRTVGGITGGTNSIFRTDSADMSIDEPPDYDDFMREDDDYFGLMDDTYRADRGV